MWPLGCFASLAMTGTELARLFLGVALAQVRSWMRYRMLCVQSSIRNPRTCPNAASLVTKIASTSSACAAISIERRERLAGSGQLRA
jgi:hypothetical protein